MDLEVDVTDPAAVARLRREACAPRRSSTWRPGPTWTAAEAARGRGRARSTPTGRPTSARAAAAVGRRAGAASRRTTSSTATRARRLHRGRRGGAAGRLRAHQARRRARPRARAHPAARASRAPPGSTARAGATSWTRCGASGRARRGRRSSTTRAARPPGPASWPRRWRPCSTLPPGIYHTAGGGSVTWAGLAAAVFEEAGLDCRVRPITTAELGRPAPRPARRRSRSRAGRAAPAPLARGAGATTWRRRRHEAPGHRRLRLHRLAPSCAWRWRAGAEVVNLDKLTYAGNPANLADVADDRGYRFVHGDIADAEAVAEAIEGVDAVVNFAAESHVDRSILDPAEFIQHRRRRHRRPARRGPHGRRAPLPAGLDRRGLRLDPAPAPSARPTRSAPPARTRPARPAATSWCSPATAPSA